MATPNFADKTIWTGDNLDILRGMNSECVDLICRPSAIMGHIRSKQSRGRRGTKRAEG